MHRKAAPVLRLRTEQFQRRCKGLGLITPTSQAEYLGLSKWTISRLLNGAIAPGEHVIACTLYAFPNFRFEDFFEVIDASTVKESAA
jgi:hypothetical protein